MFKKQFQKQSSLSKISKINSNKAQVISLDLIIACVVFMLIAVLFFSFMYIHYSRYNKQYMLTEMQIVAYNILDFLCSYSGNQTKQIGLAYNYLNLSQQKLDSFLALTPEQIAERFNIKRFDFYFEITRNSTIVYSKGTKKTLEELQSKQAISLTRTVMLNDDYFLMTIVIYEK